MRSNMWLSSYAAFSCYMYMQNKNSKSMFVTGVLENEVSSIVKNFHAKNSRDCEDVNMKIVKHVGLIQGIVKPLTHICNKSFETNTFPNSMKTAKVIPLYKNGERNRFSNYRPISLLPQFFKILEKLFYVRANNFIEKCSLLNENQYGFRHNRSTSDAILQLVENLTSAIDNKKITVGLYIDLKKAFNTIDHDILLKKMDHYGFRGMVNDWVRSYLSNR